MTCLIASKDFDQCIYCSTQAMYALVGISSMTASHSHSQLDIFMAQSGRNLATLIIAQVVPQMEHNHFCFIHAVIVVISISFDLFDMRQPVQLYHYNKIHSLVSHYSSLTINGTIQLCSTRSNTTLQQKYLQTTRQLKSCVNTIITSAQQTK